MGRLFFYLLLVLATSSCSNSIVTIENKMAGHLISTHRLIVKEDKRFVLDSVTATKAPFIQVYTDSVGVRYLTLLNPYSNSIYFFNYNNSDYIGKINYAREGANAILSMAGYYILNMDSIYIYNRPPVEIVLADSSGHVKNRIALHTDEKGWAKYYPQYIFNAVNPFIKKEDNLIFSGFAPFSIEDSLINKFHITACIDLKNNQSDFINSYPSALYGNNANWDDPLFMQTYSILSPNGELVNSFPPSHDLYITNLKSGNSKTVYGGSNVARTITSIDWDLSTGKTPDQKIIEHYLNQDLYAGILYDPWRKMYYRFMQQGLVNATTRTPLTSKPVVVIIMDEQFNYLGETLIGTGDNWNWKNSFVTEEGLNIEYLDTKDIDETFMNFKIFTIEKI